MLARATLGRYRYNSRRKKRGGCGVAGDLVSGYCPRNCRRIWPSYGQTTEVFDVIRKSETACQDKTKPT